MGVIIPAILPSSKRDLEDKLAVLESIDSVSFVQIDVIDGRFAAPACWPYTAPEEFARMASNGEMLPAWGRLKFEIDLMVADAEQVTGSWLSLGASRLAVHAESTSYLPQLITDLKQKYGHDKDFAPDLISFGLALNIDTDVSLVEQYLEQTDYVQFMGIARIGRQGEPFDRRVLKKIETFKKKHPRVPVQVDGGVSAATAPELLSIGVDRLIVGSDLWKSPDVKAELLKLAALSERYGTYE